MAGKPTDLVTDEPLHAVAVREVLTAIAEVAMHATDQGPRDTLAAARILRELRKTWQALDPRGAGKA